MGHILRTLAENTGFSHYDLLSIAESAPKRYKVFEIPKRSGGMREIAQPARELKAIQRALITHLLEKLPVHSAATAYRKGKSIRDNAIAHGALTPILKLDFKEFFPSIVSEDWLEYCQRSDLLDKEDIKLTTNYLFRKRPGERTLRLSIGAPSSPILSNILLHQFDELLENRLSGKNIVFTRYADDMTFSGQRIGMLRDVESIVNDIIRLLDRPKLKINPKKTTFITKSYRRSVTGLVIDNNNGSIGIGRPNKRKISAAVHYASLGKLSADDMGRLRGNLAFVNAVEPQFLEKLRVRYGASTIQKIQRSLSKPSAI